MTKAQRVAAAAVASAAAFLLTGCLESFVGAECADGFRESAGTCVPAAGDAGTDGSMDGGAPDGGDASMDSAVADAADAGDASMDSNVGDGGDASTDSGGTDGGAGCDLGEVLCGMECVRIDSDPRHCGGCDMPCDMRDVCSGGACVRVCRAPEEICDGRCFDPGVSNDPDNCGSCGNRCASGLCTLGSCVDATAGHVVLIGHDYQTSRPGVDRVAGNSVFLATGSPVEVVVWEGTATAASIAGVDGAIDAVAAERGRSWNRIVTSLDKILHELDRADVLLVYPQAASTDMELTDAGALLSVGVRNFLRLGGSVVVFDTPTAANAGTWQFLTGGGFMSVSGLTDITGASVSVTAPGDAIAVGVPLTYAAETMSVHFDSPEPEVVGHVDGPVVLHSVPLP
ncbi:MAG: hypothetical protein JRH11_17350 [Deltaproteobacteria bacterium]|nr:hypothetical protein [Deltaproteobacteria bacterium]